MGRLKRTIVDLGDEQQHSKRSRSKACSTDGEADDDGRACAADTGGLADTDLEPLAGSDFEPLACSSSFSSQRTAAQYPSNLGTGTAQKQRQQQQGHVGRHPLLACLVSAVPVDSTAGVLLRQMLKARQQQQQQCKLAAAAGAGVSGGVLPQPQQPQQQHRPTAGAVMLDSEVHHHQQQQSHELAASSATAGSRITSNKSSGDAGVDTAAMILLGMHKPQPKNQQTRQQQKQHRRQQQKKLWRQQRRQEPQAASRPAFRTSVSSGRQHPDESCYTSRQCGRCITTPAAAAVRSAEPAAAPVLSTLGPGSGAHNTSSSSALTPSAVTATALAAAVVTARQRVELRQRSAEHLLQIQGQQSQVGSAIAVSAAAASTTAGPAHSSKFHVMNTTARPRDTTLVPWSLKPEVPSQSPQALHQVQLIQQMTSKQQDVDSHVKRLKAAAQPPQQQEQQHGLAPAPGSQQQQQALDLSFYPMWFQQLVQRQGILADTTNKWSGTCKSAAHMCRNPQFLHDTSAGVSRTA